MHFFRIACFTLLFISASHLAGHFFLVPQFQLVRNLPGKIPANNTEHELLNLMNNYHKRIGGTPLSMMDIQNGLSLTYALFFFWTGALNLLLAKPLRRNHRLLTKISFLNAGILLIGAIISFIYFFWLPVVSFTIACLLFLIAALQYAKSRQF